MNKQYIFIALLYVLYCASPITAAQPDWSLSLQVDLGTDQGQNFGTLFELVDPAGQVIAGAGYVGAYNTQSRSDRRSLQFFVKPQQNPSFQPRRLPRPTTNAGTYLHEFNGDLFSKSRGGKDQQLKRLDKSEQNWTPDTTSTPFKVHVADGVLSSDSSSINFNGKSILNIKPDQGTLAERYYANGFLVFRLHNQKANPPVNRLVATPWNSTQSGPIDWQSSPSINMGTPREFVYAYGQLQGQVVAATNTGGLYVFDGTTWKTVLEPDTNVSFQIYTMINYRDQLLMGQYPTGEIFTYDGQNLHHVPDWPPAIPGVRKQAREAQTLTIYGGDLYCGVWPWGEVWKTADPTAGWQFSGRMFTHPEPTDKTVHPYENETKQLGSVLNRWGQRVTSLIPLGDSLYISTSSKGGNAYEPKYKFLAGEKWKEYGSVYQFTQPGSLVVNTQWTNGPTNFQFKIHQGKLQILQDGKLLGTAPAPTQPTGDLVSAKVNLQKGIFGPYRGKSIKHHTIEESPKAPFLGAYIDMNRCFHKDDNPTVAREKIEAELDRFRDVGLNTIMPKCTTSSGRANYPSSIIPTRSFPDWDPLQHFIAGARQRNLQVWPSICMMVCGHDHPAGILKQHPDWAMRNLEGDPIGYISPGHPEARKWLVSMLEELVKKYNPDGLLLDYLRYHNRPIQLDAYSAALFEKEIATSSPLSEEEKKQRLQAFRERLLTELMEQIHTSLRRMKPDLKLSIYSWGPHVLENHRVAQDWQTWVERGYLDMVNISGYLYPERNGEDYLTLFEEKLRLSKKIAKATGRQIPITFALGVRTSHGEVSSAKQIGQLLQAAKKADADGVAFFTWAYLQPWLDEVVAGDSLKVYRTNKAE